MRWVKLLHLRVDPKSIVRNIAGILKRRILNDMFMSVLIMVARSRVFVMGTVARNIQAQAIYALLYANHVFLVFRNKGDVEQLVQKRNDPPM